MEKYIKYVPLALFSLYAVKCLVFPTTFVNGVILGVLGCIAGYYEWKSQNSEVAKLRQEFSSFTEKLTTLNKSHEDLKSAVSTAKFSQQIRGVANVPR
jgi:predicted negative regulator of RcsB-dependent stress response